MRIASQKHASREDLSLKMSFMKKNFICKEKYGADTKVKLVTKIKKHNQLYFGTLV